MKRCPTCNRTFTDQNLTFCIEDGTPLVTVESSSGEGPADEATVVRSSSPGDESSSAGPSGSSSRADDDDAPAYQPPGSYTSPSYAGQQGKRKAWPWVLGCLVVLLMVIVTFIIMGKILFPVIRDANSNKHTANLNANVDRPNNANDNLNEQNSNADSNSTDADENNNDNSDAENTMPPPTDQEAVLAELKDLEDEWTVANINADKKKLNRILADDYVGITEGRAEGKAEYLKKIKRDTSIQHWEFEDLKVSLNGDRASLTGVWRLQVQNQQGQMQSAAFSFTDKFVWRDGRWQATASEVNPLK